jgi:hypothetical protein
VSVLTEAARKILATVKGQAKPLFSAGEAEAWDNSHRVGPFRVLPQVDHKAYVLVDTRKSYPSQGLPGTYAKADDAVKAAKAMLAAEAATAAAQKPAGQ